MSSTAHDPCLDVAPADSRLTTETLAPDQDPRWQRLVEAGETAGIFHHVAWLRLLRAQYGYGLQAMCVCDGDGRIRAGLPLACVRSPLTGTRLVALPFSDRCEPVLHKATDAQALRLLVRSLGAVHARNGTRIEVRAPLDERPSGARFYGHELRLEDGIESAFSKNVRRSIARSRRSGVEVLRATDAASLDTFYALHLCTRRRQGVPTQPKRFIARFGRLFEQGLGFVMVARSERQPIAAALFLAFNGVLTYKYGASARSHLDKRPNHAIFDAAIRWAREHDLRTLDFGRTDPDNEGLRAFKRSWGAEERALHYTSFPGGGDAASRAGVPRLLRAVISRTPPITGRLIGEALYGHFG